MNLETNSRPSRDASQDGLAVDDGPIFPMFSRKEDQDAWLRQQEERRRFVAEQDDRAKRPLLADYIKHPLPVLEYFRVKVSRNLDDDTMTGACAYSSDSRGALRELHKVVASWYGPGARVHIFGSTHFPAAPRGPMADDCRGFVGLKWRLAP